MASIKSMLSEAKGNKRLEGESFEDYKVRTKQEKAVLRRYLKGFMIWCSTDFSGMFRSLGTYEKAKHEHIMKEIEKSIKEGQIEDDGDGTVNEEGPTAIVEVSDTIEPTATGSNE